jgi:hypothetical protein
MKIIVAGGRDFDDQEYMARMLEKVYDSGDVTSEPELVCGMAKGADSVAQSIFESEGLVVHERPANWKDMREPCLRRSNAYGEYNAMAGIKRNHAMGDEAELLVCFWNGKSKGTKDMIDYMNKLHKPVYVFHY